MRLRYVHLALAFGATALVIRMVMLAWSGDAAITARGIIVDDAFFYTTIADNLITLGKPTFDGSTITNGFHPLWLALLSILRLFVSFDSPATVLFAISTPLIAAFLALVIRYGITELRLASTAGLLVIGATIAVNPRFIFNMSRGFETPLALLILMLVVTGWSHLPLIRSETRSFLCGLLTLARLDLAVISVIDCWYAVTIERRSPLKTALSLLLSTGPLFCYLAFSHFYFGSAFPVSGAVKRFHALEAFRGWEHYPLSLQTEGFYYIFDRMIALPVDDPWRYPISIIIWLVALIGTCIGPRSIRFLAALAVLHSASLIVYIRDIPWSAAYYVFPLYLWSAFGLAVSFDAMSRKRSLKAITLSLCVVAIASNLRDPWGYAFSITSGPEFAKKAGAVVPKEDPIAAFWPGVLSAYSGRRVLPLDGLVGSFDYFNRYVKEKRELDFVFENKVRYLALYVIGSADDALTGVPAQRPTWNYDGNRQFFARRNRFELVFASESPQRTHAWLLLKVKEDSLDSADAAE